MIATTIILIPHHTPLLNPNTTIPPPIPLPIPLTPIFTPLNLIIQPFTIPIIPFVPYNTHPYFTIKSISLHPSVNTPKPFPFSPIFKIFNTLNFTNHPPLQLIPPIPIPTPLTPKILPTTIHLNPLILLTPIITPKIIPTPYPLLSPTHLTPPPISFNTPLTPPFITQPTP